MDRHATTEQLRTVVFADWDPPCKATLGSPFQPARAGLGSEACKLRTALDPTIGKVGPIPIGGGCQRVVQGPHRRPAELRARLGAVEV